MCTNVKNLDHWVGDMNCTEVFAKRKEVWQYGIEFASEEEWPTWVPKPQ